MMFRNSEYDPDASSNTNEAPMLRFYSEEIVFAKEVNKLLMQT
jgi:hypothetical protein